MITGTESSTQACRIGVGAIGRICALELYGLHRRTNGYKSKCSTSHLSASAGARTRRYVWLEVHFTGADVGQGVMSQQRTGVHILLAYVVPPRAQILMYHSSVFALDRYTNRSNHLFWWGAIVVVFFRTSH
jgi:hypothetical protein